MIGTRVEEAATIRARALAAARALRDLLKDKTLPAEMRKQVENLTAAMGKTWADLEKDAKLDPERESDLTPQPPSLVGKGGRLVEAANMGDWFEAMLHLRFTEMADYAYSEGRLSRDERIAISGAIGDALDAFHLAVMEGALQLYVRNPYEQAEDGGSAAALSASGLERESSHLTPELSTTHPSPDRGGGESITGDYVPLVERSVRRDGSIPVKIIQPGWGSSGYYAPEMLEQNAGKFKAGTKMYWNHPTATEERERPERDLRDLAAELTSGARWDAQGEAGPGLYAEAKVFDAYKAAVDELGPHIGVSIRALGKAGVGQADGRTGKVISEISQVESVDFVTSPGAGGQVLHIFEAARSMGRSID